QKVYREECQRCHGENMLGGEETPELVGDAFLERWTGKTVGDLFERTRKTMPTDGPGNLGRQQYADVTAYILSSNTVPLGQKNVKDLAVAWRWKSQNFGRRPDFNWEVTPLMINGVLYATAGSRRDAVAIDGATGETLWMYRLDEGERGAVVARTQNRGLAYWS